MQAFVISNHGSSSNLKLKNIDDPKPKKNEVIIKHSAIGINFFDILFRKGQYKILDFPAVLGLEACGIITEIGEGVVDFKVGDRVAYATGGFGAYAEKRAIRQNHLIICPPDLSDDQIVATLFKGLTAHSLLHRVCIATRANRILIHSVAGGVGHILCQWAKYLGIEVIGTVGSEEKISYATTFGCNYVINYKSKNFVEEVAKITNNQGVGLVYDSVGKDTLNKSIDCLWPMGMCINYGDSSGFVENFDVNKLFSNSLYLTRPSMILYKSIRSELSMSATEVFAAVRKGIIKPKINLYNFNDLRRAHDDLESRKTTGSLILKF